MVRKKEVLPFLKLMNSLFHGRAGPPDDGAPFLALMLGTSYNTPCNASSLTSFAPRFRASRFRSALHTFCFVTAFAFAKSAPSLRHAKRRAWPRCTQFLFGLLRMRHVLWRIVNWFCSFRKMNENSNRQ